MTDSSLKPLLERFETVILADSSILGLLYTGSLGRGTANRYSDLDLEVWLDDEAFADLPAKTHELLTALGTIELADTSFPDFTQANIGPDWRRVDLHLRRRDDTEPCHDFAGARIVKDFDGTLARLVASSRPEDVTPTWEEARSTILGAVGDQIYLAANNARGATWEASGNITHHLHQLYELLARFRGRRTYGFRYLESILSPAEQHLIRAAWPATPERVEVRRAARELWTWTLYVWDDVEAKLGRPLDLTFNQDGLLTAIDTLYGSPDP
jgi:hypothetical protein